jgi:hypothetical protein
MAAIVKYSNTTVSGIQETNGQNPATVFEFSPVGNDDDETPGPALRRSRHSDSSRVA